MWSVFGRRVSTIYRVMFVRRLLLCSRKFDYIYYTLMLLDATALLPPIIYVVLGTGMRGTTYCATAATLFFVWFRGCVQQADMKATVSVSDFLRNWFLPCGRCCACQRRYLPLFLCPPLLINSWWCQWSILAFSLQNIYLYTLLK